MAGSSNRLRINYRSTEEILAWSTGILSVTPVEGLGGAGNDSPAVHRSLLHGRRPHTGGHNSEHPGPGTDGVRLAAMHAIKGLEFQAVAVTGVTASAPPFEREITPADVNRLQHGADPLRKRCLLFVACTQGPEGARRLVERYGTHVPARPRVVRGFPGSGYSTSGCGVRAPLTRPSRARAVRSVLSWASRSAASSISCRAWNAAP